MNEKIICDCGHIESDHSEHTRGYGITPDNKKICWDCCAENEREIMRTTGKNTMYLVKRDGKYFVTDWTGKVEFKVKQYSTSRHNFGCDRVDVWFDFEGQPWHGYQIGDNNQICHCKRNKKG